jgi:hypothetical protein
MTATPVATHPFAGLAPVVILALLAAPLAAQQADTASVRATPFALKYGKWAALATAVGMGIKAAGAHADADRAFRSLNSYCFDDHARCDIGVDGHYLDPVAERYYQTSVRRDRHARGWLFGGEAALLATAGLFVCDLTRPKRPPRNIPFAPTVSVAGAATRIGMRLEF